MGNSYFRKLQKLFIVFTLLIFIIMSVKVSSKPDESWKLDFHYKETSSMALAEGTFKTETGAQGTVSLQILPGGEIAGSGNISVTINIEAQLAAGVLFSPLKGSGSVTIRGKRDASNLVFWFEEGQIPCKGVIKVSTPAGSQSIPFETPFSPDIITGPNMVIKREEGTQATGKISLTDPRVMGEATFKLYSGRNILEVSPELKGEFPEDPNIWVLELDHTLDSVYAGTGMQGTVKDKMQGRIEFAIPYGDGQVKGEGPLVYNSEAITSFGTTSIVVQGKLILEGEIIDGVLSFIPRVMMEEAKVTKGPLTGTNTGPTSFFNEEEAIFIPVENGAEMIQHHLDDYGEMKCYGQSIWRLQGEKREVWLITLEGYDRFLTAIQISGGVKVHWENKISVEIVDKRFKTGTAEAYLISVEPYSIPEGVFDTIITNVETYDYFGMLITPDVNKKHFTVDGELLGDLLFLDLYYPKHYDLGYWISWQCILNEAVAAAKIPYWEEKKQGLLKEYDDKIFWPFPPRIQVFLVDGWTASTGTPESINYEKHSVKRIY